MDAYDRFVDAYRGAAEAGFRRLPPAPWADPKAGAVDLDGEYVPIGLQPADPTWVSGAGQEGEPPDTTDDLAGLARLHRVILLMGDAGSGKSTVLRYLALRAARTSDAELPVVARLARYHAWLEEERDADLGTFLARAMADVLLTRDVPDVASLAERTGLLLLLDGLDEVPAPRRARVLDGLARFLEGATGTLRVVVSSRPRPALGLDGVETRWLCDWGSEALGVFLERSLLLRDRPHHEVRQAVMGDGDLASMLGRPLCAAMAVALLVQRPADLPAEKTRLYEQCAALLVERLRGEQAGDGSPAAEEGPFASTEKAMGLLGSAALSALRRGGGAIVRRAEFLQVAASYYRDAGHDGGEAANKADELADEIRQRSGIIVDHPERSLLRFFHRSFAEYAAAVHLCGRSDDRLEAWLLEHGGRPAWDRVVRFVVGTVARQSDDLARAARLLEVLRHLPMRGLPSGRWRVFLLVRRIEKDGTPLPSTLAHWVARERRNLLRTLAFAAPLRELARLDGTVFPFDEEKLDRIVQEQGSLGKEVRGHRDDPAAACRACTEVMRRVSGSILRPREGFFSPAAVLRSEVALALNRVARDETLEMALRDLAFSALWRNAVDARRLTRVRCARAAADALAVARSVVQGSELPPPRLRDAGGRDVPVLEALLEVRGSVLIVGGPGQGKTRALGDLVTALPTQHTPCTPVVLPCSLPEAGDVELVQGVREAVGLGADSAESAADSPAVVVLVDDLDLCSSPAVAALRLTRLPELLGLPVMVAMASRSPRAGDLLDDTARYRVEPEATAAGAPRRSRFFRDLAGAFGEGSRAELVRRFVTDGPGVADWPERLGELAYESALASEGPRSPAVRDLPDPSSLEAAGVLLRDGSGRLQWRSRVLAEVLAGARLARRFEVEPGCLPEAVSRVWLDPAFATDSAVLPAAASLAPDPPAFVEAVLSLPEGIGGEATLAATRCVLWLGDELPEGPRRRVLGRAARLLRAGVLRHADELLEEQATSGLSGASASVREGETQAQQPSVEASEPLERLLGADGNAKAWLRHLRARPDLVLPGVLAAWAPVPADLLDDRAPPATRLEAPHSDRLVDIRVRSGNGVVRAIDLEVRFGHGRRVSKTGVEVPPLCLALSRETVSDLAGLLWEELLTPGTTDGWQAVREALPSLDRLLAQWPDAPEALDRAWSAAVLGHFLLACSAGRGTPLAVALVQGLDLPRRFGCTHEEAHELLVEAWYLAALADGLATHLACRLSSVQLQDLDARLMPDVLQLARSLGQRAVNSCGALLLGRAAAERWSPESRLGRVYAELGRPVFREDAGPGSLAWSPLRFLRLLCREIAPPLPAGQVRLEGFGVRLAGSTAAGDTPALVPGMLTVRLLGEATELAGLRELRARLVQSLRAALFSAVEVAVGDEERGEALAEDESAGRTPPPTSPDAGVVELHGAGKHREALERLLERLPGRHPGWVHATVRDVWRHYARGEVGLDHADRERGRDLWAVVARGVPSDELVAEARLTSAAGGDAVRGASAGLFWAVLLETLDEPGRDRVLEAMVEAVPTGPFACLAIQPPLREQHARLSGETLRRARRAMAAAASCDELGFGERKLARLFLELTRAKGGT